MRSYVSSECCKCVMEPFFSLLAAHVSGCIMQHMCRKPDVFGTDVVGLIHLGSCTVQTSPFVFGGL